MPTVTRSRYDALVFDLDGTLLDATGRLTPATRAQVARARSLGFVVVLATGRSLSGAAEVHRELELDTDIVAYNGSWIGRPGATPWHYAAIPDELVAALAQAESRAAFLFRHHGERKFTARTPHPHHDRAIAWYTNVVAHDPGATLPDRDLVRVSLFYGDRPATDEAWDAMPGVARERLHREVFPMSLFPEFHDTDLVLCEVQGKGRGKAEALRLLAERHGVPAHRVVAVGDQSNDVCLLAEVGLPVAMGNAIDAAKAKCRVVIGHHREEGVARWLEREMG